MSGVSVFPVSTQLPPATCEIVHQSGSRTRLKALSNTDAAQGTILEIAKAMAVATDQIWVYRYGQTTANLAKDGVDWTFFPGSGVTNPSNSAGFIFDNTGMTVGSNVYGWGNFERVIAAGDSSMVGSVGSAFGGASLTTGGDTGVFCNNIAASDLLFEFNEAGMEWTGAAVNGSPYQSILQSRMGNVKFKGRRLYNISNTYSVSTVGAWWILGKCLVEIDQFDCISYNAYGACSNAATGDFYVKSEEFSQGVAVCACTDPAAGMWIRGGTIRQNGNDTTVFNDGGKLYVNVQKQFGGISLSCASSSSQTFYKSLPKFGGVSAASDYIYADGTGTPGNTIYAELDIGKFDPESASRLLQAKGANTKVIFEGGDHSVLAGVEGIFANNSAQVELQTGHISTGSGQKDLHQATSAVISVSAGYVYDGTKITGTITHLKTFGS